MIRYFILEKSKLKFFFLLLTKIRRCYIKENQTNIVLTILNFYNICNT